MEIAVVPRDVEAGDERHRLQRALVPTGRGAVEDAFLRAPAGGVGADLVGERGARGLAHPAAVARRGGIAGAEGRLHDEVGEVIEHVLARRVLAAPPGGGVGQLEFLAEDVAAERLEEAEQRRGLERAGAGQIGEGDAAVVRGVDEPGHAEERTRVELEWVAKFGIEAAQHDVHLLQAADGAEEDLAVARRQVLALDERVAEVVGKVGLLEIGFVGRAGREQHDARVLAVRCEVFQRLAVVVEKLVQPLDRRAVEDIGQRLPRDDAVLQRVAEAGRRIEAVLDHPPAPVGGARDIHRQRVQESGRTLAEADAGPQEVRVVQRDGGGHQAAVQELLLPVEIEKQFVEEVGALA